MADDPVNSGGAGSDPSDLVISEEISQKFPELIEMIKASRSMNNEERQYWLDALSIMSDEQVKNLYSILENERQQIKTAEENYKKSTQTEAKNLSSPFDSEAYLEKKRARQEAELLSQQKEQEQEQSLLAQLDAL